MKTVEIRYGVTFGKGDSSDWLEDEVDLTDEEERIYDDAVENGVLLEEIPELRAALNRAREIIEDREIDIGVENEDEYILECLGLLPMDADALNDLVADRDPHALAFFELEDASEDELDEWDAYDLDELPTIAAFQEDFEPSNPFDGGWRLHVEFVDPNE